MTVQELIAQLQLCDPGAPVWVECYGDGAYHMGAVDTFNRPWHHPWQKYPGVLLSSEGDPT